MNDPQALVNGLPDPWLLATPVCASRLSLTSGPERRARSLGGRVRVVWQAPTIVILSHRPDEEGLVQWEVGYRCEA